MRDLFRTPLGLLAVAFTIIVLGVGLAGYWMNVPWWAVLLGIVIAYALAFILATMRPGSRPKSPPEAGPSA